MNRDGIEKAFDAFLYSGDLEPAIVESTIAGWNGSGYSVELLEDGTYRVLSDNSIGNLYTSPGLMLSVPHLSDEDYRLDNPAYDPNKDDDTPRYLVADLRRWPKVSVDVFFDDAIEELSLRFDEWKRMPNDSHRWQENNRWR